MRPHGAADMQERMRAQGFKLPPTHTLEGERRTFVRLQAMISDNFKSQGEHKLVAPPPCVRCPADVLHYCETTGSECKKFEVYCAR